MDDEATLQGLGPFLNGADEETSGNLSAMQMKWDV